MENRPNPDQRLIEAIEACRPGSDDLLDPALEFLAERLANDPELAEAYDRLQQIDGTVSAAFQDVPVPDGLGEQILARLALEESAPPVDPGDETAQPVAPIVSAKRTRPPRTGRRWFVISGVAACGLAALVLMNSGPDEAITQSELLNRAIEFFQAEMPPTGELVLAKPPPREYPFSGDLASLAQTRWRALRNFLGSDGVAYDMTLPGGAKATLYVVTDPGSIPKLPNSPTAKPTFNSRQFSTAAWQSQNLLYVLVVQGDRRAYGKALRSAGPLA